jgi:acyl carrier protein
MATNDEILAGMAQLADEVADGAPNDVDDDRSFVDDLGVDSVSTVEAYREPDETAGARIPDDELPNLETVGDAVKYISQDPS